MPEMVSAAQDADWQRTIEDLVRSQDSRLSSLCAIVQHQAAELVRLREMVTMQLNLPSRQPCTYTLQWP